MVNKFNELKPILKNNGFIDISLLKTTKYLYSNIYLFQAKFKHQKKLFILKKAHDNDLSGNNPEKEAETTVFLKKQGINTPKIYLINEKFFVSEFIKGVRADNLTKNYELLNSLIVKYLKKIKKITVNGFQSNFQFYKRLAKNKNIILKEVLEEYFHYYDFKLWNMIIKNDKLYLVDAPPHIRKVPWQVPVSEYLHSYFISFIKQVKLLKLFQLKKIESNLFKQLKLNKEEIIIFYKIYLTIIYENINILRKNSKFKYYLLKPIYYLIFIKRLKKMIK